MVDLHLDVAGEARLVHENRQELVAPFADLAANLGLLRLDLELGEGLDPGPGVQVYAVEKRAVDVEHHGPDAGAHPKTDPQRGKM